jgi:hypothetical protein
MTTVKPLIKFYRHEGNKVILIPTTEGLEYLKMRPEQQKFVSDKLPPSGLRLEISEDTIGGAKLIALVGTLDGDIINITVNQNMPNNYFKMQVYTGNQTRYFLNLPFTMSNGDVLK